MRRLMIAAFVAAALVFPAGVAQAADAPAAATALKIGLVNVQQVMATSKAGKSLQSQINSQNETFKKQFEKLQKELESDRQALIKDKEKQGSPDFIKKQKSFESKMAEDNKLVQQKRVAIEKGASEALGKIRNGIAAAAKTVADREGYSLIVTRDNVILAREEMDITAKILTQMDKDMPNVKLTLDDSSSSAGSKK